MQQLLVSRCVTLLEFHKLRGKGYSYNTVRKWIDKGILKKGKHFIHTPGGVIKVDPEMVDLAIFKLNQ